MKNDFPPEEILVARGKYSTINAERRAVFKALRDDIEAVFGCCQRALRDVEKDIDFAIEQVAIAKKRFDAANDKLSQAAALTHHLTELKPLAWGDKKEPE
jgi:hypothetical protein